MKYFKIFIHRRNPCENNKNGSPKSNSIFKHYSQWRPVKYDNNFATWKIMKYYEASRGGRLKTDLDGLPKLQLFRKVSHWWDL